MSKLFDGAVDTYFIWIFEKAPNKDAIDRTYVYNETYWYPFQGKVGTLDYKLGTYSYFEQYQTEHQIGLQWLSLDSKTLSFLQAFTEQAGKPKLF